MKIYAIRHGLTEFNKKEIINGQLDEPLSAEGFQQAKNAIDSVPDTVQYIYASSLLRARQTAEVLNVKLKRPVSFHDELQEINLGVLAGKSWENMESGDELRKKHRSVAYDYREHGGESVEAVKARLLRFLESISGRHSDHEALLVTHGGIIRLLYFLEHGTPPEKVENVSLHSFDSTKVLRSHNT